MTYDRVFLASVVALFIITFVIIMAFVNQRGYSAKGKVGAHTMGAVVTSGATLLWLVVALFYIFEARSVTWFVRISLLDNGVVKAVGVSFCTIGLVVCIAGEAALGESFRLALPEAKTELITRGIYRYIRNPCVLGAILLALGTLLIAPSLLAFVALVANGIGYEMKVRAEEEYLRRTHKAEYEAYCANTGRYLPLVRRLNARKRIE